MAQLQASTVAGTLTTTGNVGVGTTISTSKLYIEGGSANWNETTPGLSVGTIHLDPGADTNDFGNAITFGASDASSGTNAQAGIYLRSDGNYGTKMYFATTDSYAAGSKTRMFIGHDGYVGIGTVTPYEILDIVGNIRLGNFNTVSGTRYIGYGNNTFANQFIAGMSIESTTLGGNYSQKLNFATHHFGVFAGVRMTLDEQGNLGIGSTAPTTRLDVNGNTTIRGSLAFKTTGTNNGNLIISDNGGGTATINNSSNSFLDITSAASTTITGGNFIVNNSIGIGTASPAYKFHLQGSNLMATLRNSSTSANQYTQIEFLAGSRDAYIWLGNQATTSWAGDGGLNIYTGTGNMDFWTAASQRMRITSGGNVGIGTLDPGTYKLNVNGWLGAERIYPYNTNSTYLYGDGGGVSVGGTGYFYSNGNAGSYFQNAVRFRSAISDDANAYLTINGGTSGFTYFNGNVGIGTINPQNKLHIWNGTIEVTGFQSAGSPLTFLESNYNSVDAVKIRFLNYNPSNGLDSDLGIQVMNTGGSMVEVITAKGSNSRVGINTSIPENTLHVYKGSAGTVTANSNSPIVIENSTNAYLNILVPDANESGILFGRPTSDVDGGIIYNSNISRGLEFRTAGNDFKMGITSTGNVGIGTTNPPTKLYVAGNGEFTDTLFISKGASDAIQQGSSVYLVGGSGASYTQLQQGVGRFIIFGFNGSSWIERFTINNTSGNVGIGTAAPRKELDVQGNNLCVVAGQLILGEDAFSTSTSYIGLKTSFQSGTTDYMILSGKSDGATYVSAKAGSSVYIRSGGNTSTAQIEVTDTYARTYSNLGVGTAPSQALDVAGNIRSSNVIYWNGIIGALSWDTGLVTMETNSATAIVLKTNSAERLRIASNGSVGIGISSPSAKLEIVGDVFIPSTNPLYMGGTAGSLSSWGSRQITNSGIHTLSAGAFSVDNSGYVSPVTSSLYVDTLKGNVGIRTTTPAWPLDVVGNARIGDNTAQQKFAALQVSSGQGGAATTYRDIDMCGSWAVGEGHAITAMYSTGVNNIVGQIVFEHNSPGSRIKFGRLYDSGDQSTYPMNLVSNGSNGNLGINTTAPAADLHIDSGATGATAYPFRTDAASLDYALYVSSSGNVAVGGLVPAAQLNHKLVVFSGSIALRGPNDPNFSYRLNDTGGTNRNALYVSSSNYLNVGNAAFAGLQLFHTGSFETAYTPTGENLVRGVYSNTTDNDVLGTPDNWLAIRINTTNYVIPMYTP